MHSDFMNNSDPASKKFTASRISSINDLSLEYHDESNMFRFILENHHDPVFLMKIEFDSFSGSFVDFNQHFCEHLGYTREELFQLVPLNIYAPENISLVKKNMIKNLEETSLKWEGVTFRKDGQRIPVEIKSYVFKKERYHLTFVFWHDISYYKQSIQDLHNHQSLLERAESIGRMGYWEYDLKNDKFWASHGARLIYGLGERELTFAEVKMLPFPEYRSKLDQIFDNLIAHDEKYDVEFKIFRQNDGVIVDIRSMAEYDILEKKIYGIIQDISQQKVVEQELIKAKEEAEISDRLKTAFLSNMSHEIRTPMNGIIGFSNLLTDSETNPAERREYKEIIQQCCSQLLNTVDDILDIAKIQSGQVAINSGWVNINKLLKELHEYCLPQTLKKGIELRLSLTDSINELVLLSDREKLYKIFLNLIENAIRFTHSGYVEFGYMAHEACIEFYVKDTGIGISPVHHDIIFQPFCQADTQISQSYGGTGLGLTITKAYVTMIGGQIWLESKVGEGSTFFFTQPWLHTAKRPAENKTVSIKNNTSKTCLIVEDLEMNYSYLKVLLKPMGFNVLWAKDGNEAIEMALGNPDIDLVLMDIRLPRINGYEATRIIKEKRPDLPIIAQSANSLLDERNQALECGCDDYMTKPIYKEEFSKIVESFFGNS